MIDSHIKFKDLPAVCATWQQIPIVSVVITNYNHKDTVMDAIQSVLDQRCDLDVEIIVVDDGSTDGSVELLKQSWPDTIFLDHVGMGKAYEVGFENASGLFYAICDADDVYSNPLKLQLQVTALTDSMASVCFTDTEQGIRVPKRMDYGEMLVGNFIPAPTALWYGWVCSGDMWDYKTWLDISGYSFDGYFAVYLPVKTVGYSVNAESFSHTRSRRRRAVHLWKAWSARLGAIRKNGVPVRVVHRLAWRLVKDITCLILKRWSGARR